MRRHVDGPSHVDRLSKNFIDHPPTPISVTTDGNSYCLRKFPIFLERPRFNGNRYRQVGTCWASLARSRIDRKHQNRPYSRGNFLALSDLLPMGKSGRSIRGGALINLTVY